MKWTAVLLILWLLRTMPVPWQHYDPIDELHDGRVPEW